MASSSQSNGRAVRMARNISFGTAECLTTAPSGARFPFRIAMVPSLEMGSSKGLMISVRFSPQGNRKVSQCS